MGKIYTCSTRIFYEFDTFFYNLLVYNYVIFVNRFQG